MEEELREALRVFRTGVQFAVTISCFAVGASLGAVVVSGSALAGTLWGLGVMLLIGLVMGATASYMMFRAESRKINQVQHPGSQNSTDHAADYGNQ